MTEKNTVEEVDDLFDLDEGDETAETEQAPAVDVKEVEELRGFKQQTEPENREAAVADAFTAAGLSPKAARLFIALNPGVDPTPELVKRFAGDYDLGPPPDRSGYTPTVISGGHVPAAKTFTRAEFEDIMRENPARGRALAESGRVRWSNAQINERPQR